MLEYPSVPEIIVGPGGRAKIWIIKDVNRARELIQSGHWPMIRQDSGLWNQLDLVNKHFESTEFDISPQVEPTTRGTPSGRKRSFGRSA
jgi:hypothetical protein